MAVQLSVSVRNARLNAIESTIGTAPKLQIRTDGAPADCAAASTGTLLAELTLPSNWLADAAAGAKALAGTWTGTAVDTGTAAHFRLFDSGGSTCHMQGSITAGGGGGDMTLDSTSITTSDTVNVSSFSLTDANA